MGSYEDWYSGVCMICGREIKDEKLAVLLALYRKAGVWGHDIGWLCYSCYEKVIKKIKGDRTRKVKVKLMSEDEITLEDVVEITEQEEWICIEGKSRRFKVRKEDVLYIDEWREED